MANLPKSAKATVAVALGAGIASVLGGMAASGDGRSVALATELAPDLAISGEQRDAQFPAHSIGIVAQDSTFALSGVIEKIAIAANQAADDAETIATSAPVVAWGDSGTLDPATEPEPEPIGPTISGGIATDADSDGRDVLADANAADAVGDDTYVLESEAVAETADANPLPANLAELLLAYKLENPGELPVEVEEALTFIFSDHLDEVSDDAPEEDAAVPPDGAAGEDDNAADAPTAESPTNAGAPGAGPNRLPRANRATDAGADADSVSGLASDQWLDDALATLPSDLNLSAESLLEPTEHTNAAVQLAAALLLAKDVEFAPVSVFYDPPPEEPELPETLTLEQAVELWGTSLAEYPNGEIPLEAMCQIEFAPAHRIRCDAAYLLNLLNEAYHAEFGTDLAIVSSYRTIGEQFALAVNKPNLAATPGTSKHGLGLAIDFGSVINNYSSAQHIWMRLNAPDFGWDNPVWARANGSRLEPWHWEFHDGLLIPNRALGVDNIVTVPQFIAPEPAPMEPPVTEETPPAETPPAEIAPIEVLPDPLPEPAPAEPVTPAPAEVPIVEAPLTE